MGCATSKESSRLVEAVGEKTRLQAENELLKAEIEQVEAIRKVEANKLKS